MIFISYRRPEADDHAGRLIDRLQHWFDPDEVFYDKNRNSIDMGDDFPAEIKAGMERAHVVLGNLASTLCAQGDPPMGADAAGIGAGDTAAQRRRANMKPTAT